jgi:hypothetical protein
MCSSNQVIIRLLVSCALLWLSPAEGQTLKVRYPLSDATANTFYPSDTSLGGVAAANLITANSANVAVNKHGVAGSGVGGITPAMDFTGQADGAAGPIAYNTADSNLGFGLVTNWTVTLWFKQDPNNGTTGSGSQQPYLFLMGTNGVTGNAVANSLTVRMSPNPGTGQNNVAGDLEVLPNTIGEQDFQITTPANTQLSGWRFVAITYNDSTKALTVYTGTTNTAVALAVTSSKTLSSSAAVNFGSSGSMSIGNRTSDRVRIYSAWYQDFRFYSGAASQSTLEQIRQSILPPAINSGGQPQSGAYAPGQTVQLTVVASGAAPLVYQWQATNSLGGFTNLVDVGQITGSQSNMLTIVNVATGNALAYEVIVTNNYGSVTSAPAILSVLSVPIINSQPVSQTALSGSTVSFTVGATGVGTLGYQWQASGGAGYTNLVDNGSVSGSGTSTLTLTGVTTNFALAYQVIVTNANGSVTSAPPATLTVLPATCLINGDFGTGATQTGAALLGSPGDAWNALSASTGTVANSAGNTLSGVGLNLNDYGVFLATGGTVTDPGTTNLMQDYAYGYSTTPTVTTTITGLAPYINSAFTLVIYAAGNAVGQGGSLTLTGAAGGNAVNTLTTTASSRQVSAGPGVAYNTYTGVLTNGTLTFTSAILPGQSFTAVNGFQLQLSPLVIVTQPVSQTNFAGNTATFTVGAVGAGILNYQWQATNAASGGFTNLTDGGQVSGSQSNVLTIANLTTNWALAYQVIVSNGSGSVTSAPAAILTLLSSPIITMQPASQTSVAGSPVTFNVTALGTSPLGYQWQATNSSAGGFTNITGANASGLTLTGVTTNFALSYQVIVTNSYGSVTSAVAGLTVLASIIPPNIPDPGAMARSIVANVVGSYTAPPTKLPSNLVTGAPVVANGDLTCVVGGPSTNLQFYFSKADFWGVLRGAIQPVGSLVLTAPAFSGSSYALNENIGPATLTGAFANGAASLTLTSWVASAENTTVIQLNNNGSSPLSLTSQMLDGFAGTTGNPATYGSTNNSTWLKVSPDTVYLELGNELHNQFGAAPFTGKIADLRLYNQALSGTTLGNLDGVGVPTPLLRWSTTNTGVATPVGAGASLNPADPFGGSVALTGDSASELAVGDLPLPENQFTFSTWIYPTTTGGNGCIIAAQIPNSQQYSGYPYPYVRGLTLKLVNGALSASLNQSGGLNTSSMLFTADAVNTYSTTATSALPANQWIQAAVTYDGNTLTIFTNGVAVGIPVTFPTGTSGMLSYNKMVVHIGDTNLPYNGCAPQGVLMQNVLGATATTSSQGALSFTIPAGGQVTLVVAAVTDRNNTNYFAAAQQQVQQATIGSLSNLFQAHSAWWSNFWSKSFVQIPNQMIQDSWYGSLYLLACCNSSNCPPPSKLGNCITSRTPGWQGDYNLDYNYEASPYTAIANNHQELMENYMKPLLEEMPRGQSAAQFLYGMTNALLYYDHWVPAPGWSDDPGTFWGQKSQSLFGAVDCVMRWRYTQDTNYAAIIYPYLKGVANFWDNYLVLNNGYYVDNNDSCWEQSGNDTNPVTTLAFIQLLYPELVKISQILNVDADRRAKWNDIIAHLTPLPIVPASSIASLNNLGAPYNAPGVNVIRNSTAGTAFPTPMVTLYQDHTVRSSSAGMSCPQVIFPGWNIGLESDPALLQAASNTVWLAAQWFDYNDNCTFYPGAACAGYDPNAILSNLNTMLTYYRYPSFVIDVGGDSTEQYAIVPATLAAMFVQSYQTNIHVFPNWPTNQSAAFANHNACGGFLISSAITLGSANYVQIQSTAGQMLNLANPWPGAVVQCVSSLTGISTLSGPVLHYQTQMGEVLTLISTSVTNLSAPINLTVSTNSSAVNLNWNAVPGAAGYNVKRSTTIGGPFLNLASGITGTNYTDTSAAYATTYYYTVTALAPGFESTNSITVAITTPPAPPILNWSFESQTVTAGSYAIETPTDWNVSGQSGGAVVAVIHPAAGDGRFSSYPPLGLNGSNYCQLFMNGGTGSATVYQDLGSANPYQAGTTYTLTAAFGLEKGVFPTGTLALYNSSLVAIASNVITPAMLTSNAFTSYSVTYTATGNEGGNGDLVIGFTTTGAAAGTSFDVDNVRLTAMASASTNADLTSLSLNPAGILTPAFATNTFSYTATEAYGNAPAVTVTNADLTATNQLICNGATNLLASGTASSPLALTLGVTNLVQVQVTAQDGVTMQTYTVNVTELPNESTQPSLTNRLSNGALNLTWGLDRLGYRLLMQTNHLNLGVSVNPNDWTTVPSSTSTNQMAIPIGTTNLDAYYRLVYP